MIGAASLVVVFCIVCYLIYKNTPPEDRQFVLTIMIIGFLVRLSISLTLHAISYTKTIYQGATSGDDLLYMIKSWALVYKWEGRPDNWAQIHIGSSPQFGLNPYTYLLAIFYKLFGFHPVSSKIINCILGTMVGWVSYLIGREIFDSKTAKISILLVTFYPSLVRWSSANLKDSLTMLLFFVPLYILIVAISRRAAIWRVIILALSLVGLYFSTQRLHLVLIMGSIGVLLFSRGLDLLNSKRAKRLMILIAASVLSITLSYLFYVKPQMVIESIYKCEENQALIAKSDFAGYYLYTRDFMADLNRGVFSIFKFLNIAFINVVYFIFTPFPWQLVSRERIIAFPQVVLWYTLLMLSIFGFAELVLNRFRIAFLLAAVLIVGITINSLAEGNIGAAFRHRDMYTPIFIVVASAMLRNLIDGEKAWKIGREEFK